MTAWPSGFYDMDVARVVFDWTGSGSAVRSPVHPLMKLFVAPLGGLLSHDRMPVVDRLDRVRVISVLAMTAYALLCGVLAAQLSGRAADPDAAARRRHAFWIATLVCGVSFSGLLLAAVPESASFSGLGLLVPLVYLNTRLGRSFDRREIAGWAGVGVVAIAFTVTQVVHFVIALGLRLFWIARDRDANVDRASALRRALPGAAAAVALCVGVTFGGLELQGWLYPKAKAFYETAVMANEQQFMRIDDLRETPGAHLVRLTKHFVLFDWVAPFPGYSDFLIEKFQAAGRGRQAYWGLSLEVVPVAGYVGAQWLAVIALLGLYGLAVRGGLAADRRLLAPTLCVASQLGLHLLYGREYVLYSTNWHGAAVAVVVALALSGAGRVARFAPAIAALVITGMLANNLTVLDRTYDEARHRLSVAVRDETGRPK